MSATGLNRPDPLDLIARGPSGIQKLRGLIYALSCRGFAYPNRARTRATAARTWAGAVPPMWLRAWSEPSRVSTA